jgi:Mrp family chromosome partitioning ATPase
MSAIDQAFIRAYELDDGGPATLPIAPPGPRRDSAGATNLGQAPPSPHAPFAGRTAAARPAQGATGGASERRPLSAYAPPPPVVEARFRPGLEVDAFRWSQVSTALVGALQARWDAAVEAILNADQAGCSLIGVAGGVRGAGATTVAACLARLLAMTGKSVALVDGDFAGAALARSLGLAVDVGWEDVLAGRAPLADAVIHSLGDQLAVLPLVGGGSEAADMLDSIHASITAGVLRYHYDLVLFDLGDVADAGRRATACRIANRCRLDGLLLVAQGAMPGRPPRVGAIAATRAAELARSAPELAGICLGVIENQLVAA